jgi:hypothetical protein
MNRERPEGKTRNAVSGGGDHRRRRPRRSGIAHAEGKGPSRNGGPRGLRGKSRGSRAAGVLQAFLREGGFGPPRPGGTGGTHEQGRVSGAARGTSSTPEIPAFTERRRSRSESWRPEVLQ